MISQIILLNHGDGTRTNQHVVGGKYLVLNAPWCESPRNVILRRQGNQIYIESKDIVCKVLCGKIAYLETVYPMDKDIGFLEMTPEPPAYDFFLSKRYLLDRISGKRPSGAFDNKIVPLRRRQVSRIVVPVLLQIFRDAVEYILVEIPRNTTTYIMTQVAGVEQNAAVKMVFCAVARVFYSLQSMAIRRGCPVVFVNSLYLVPTRLHLSIFFGLYSSLITVLIESIQLLNNSSYNPLKKRRDAIILSTDQIFMSVLIFSFSLLVLMNIARFHLLFVFMNCCLMALRFAEDFVDFFFTDTSDCCTYELVFDDDCSGPVFRYSGISVWAKTRLALEAGFCLSRLSGDKPLARLLLGK